MGNKQNKIEKSQIGENFKRRKNVGR